MVVLATTFGLAAASQWFFPTLSVSYVIVASLAAGFTVVPRLGDRWAAHRGAPMMTRQERTRRYLSELGPIGSPENSSNMLLLAQEARLRRNGTRPKQRRG